MAADTSNDAVSNTSLAGNCCGHQCLCVWSPLPWASFQLWSSAPSSPPVLCHLTISPKGEDKRSPSHFAFCSQISGKFLQGGSFPCQARKVLSTLWVLFICAVLCHSLAKLGLVLMTGFVLGTRKGLSRRLLMSQQDALFRQSLWSRPVGLGGLQREGCGAPSPRGEATGLVSTRDLLSAPDSGDAGNLLLMEPGRKMKGGHVSWGNCPAHQGALEEILFSSSEASISLLQPHNPLCGTLQ